MWLTKVSSLKTGLGSHMEPLRSLTKFLTHICPLVPSSREKKSKFWENPLKYTTETLFNASEPCMVTLSLQTSWCLLQNNIIVTMERRWCNSFMRCTQANGGGRHRRQLKRGHLVPQSFQSSCHQIRLKSQTLATNKHTLCT